MGESNEGKEPSFALLSIRTTGNSTCRHLYVASPRVRGPFQSHVLRSVAPRKREQYSAGRVDVNISQEPGNSGVVSSNISNHHNVLTDSKIDVCCVLCVVL